jgi:hypothetical protein
MCWGIDEHDELSAIERQMCAHTNTRGFALILGDCLSPTSSADGNFYSLSRLGRGTTSSSAYRSDRAQALSAGRASVYVFTIIATRARISGTQHNGVTPFEFFCSEPSPNVEERDVVRVNGEVGSNTWGFGSLLRVCVGYSTVRACMRRYGSVACRLEQPRSL